MREINKIVLMCDHGSRFLEFYPRGFVSGNFTTM